MDGLSATLVWGYVAGVALFLVVIDEPVRSRLTIALIWPIPMLILAVVIGVLVVAACVLWWPLALILAALGLLVARIS